MLTKDEKVLVTPDLLEQFIEINKALDRCYEMALKQLLPKKQIALMTDASFSATRYAVLIEDDPFEKNTSTIKAFAPVDLYVTDVYQVNIDIRIDDVMIAVIIATPKMEVVRKII